jgi:hypothetical protein
MKTTGARVRIELSPRQLIRGPHERQRFSSWPVSGSLEH